jgi:hypothetical protein
MDTNTRRDMSDTDAALEALNRIAEQTRDKEHGTRPAGTAARVATIRAALANRSAPADGPYGYINGDPFKAAFQAGIEAERARAAADTTTEWTTANPAGVAPMRMRRTVGTWEVHS